MRKPRVAFFIDQWRPGSGTENQLQGLLAHLSPEHVEATLFTLRVPLEAAHRQLFPCPVECLGIGSLLSPGALLRLPAVAARLRRGRFDVAMIYFVDSNLYLVPAARLAGIPAVVVNRRDMGYWYEKSLLRKLNFVNRWATHFLVNAEAVKSQVVTHEHFDPARIAVIPNGMWDRTCGGDAGAAVRDGLPAGFPADGPVVGITASLREVKRLDRFLEMAAAVSQQVPSARFVIAGQGHLGESLAKQARDLGIADAVVFLGQVTNVAALLERLQVGVLTSDSEGLSNSLVEYGLAGLPAVTFAVGGNGEVVCEGRTGFLVPPGDTAALADRVVRLLLDQALRDRMSTAARDHCTRTYAPDHIRELTLSYFRTLMSAEGR